MRPRSALSLPLLMATFQIALADANVRVEPLKTGGAAVYRPGIDTPIFAFNAPENGRPYVHPLLAPDGQGILTEYSPSHHKHQTGIYVGFLKANGRDFFHNRGGDHFLRRDFIHKMTPEGVVLKSVYDLLGKDKKPLLLETQHWVFHDFTDNYAIDLTLTLQAQVDVTFDRHDYGGLFVRMPWTNQPDARAANSEGAINAKAEGQKARWVDLGMTVVGRKRPAHIAILSRDETPWRVDGQLGVGPAPSRVGAWKLAAGHSRVFRYRFLVYTGIFQPDRVEAEWKALRANNN